MTQLLPENKPKPEPSTLPKNAALAPTIIMAALSGLGLIGVMSFLPQLGFFPANKQTVGLTPATVTMQDNQEDKSTLRVFWDTPVTQPQFWFNDKLVRMSCDTQTCTIPKPVSTELVYFRWMNTTDNKWYYFQCNGDYRGKFQGIPYTQ